MNRWNSLFALTLAAVVPYAMGFAAAQDDQEEPPAASEETSLDLAFLEIVTPDADATCAALEKLHGVKFGEPRPELGNARTATLKGGGRVSVRAPMHEQENSVVRPYFRVDDINAAVTAAEGAGGQIAVPAMELPGQGKFAIYFHGGIEHGLWE